LVLRLGTSVLPPPFSSSYAKNPRDDKPVMIEITECNCGSPHRLLIRPSETVETLKYRVWLMTQQSTFCTVTCRVHQTLY
jgi:hypothetical protein